MSIHASIIFLLASSHVSLALPLNGLLDIVARKYTNPDPANDPANFFGYVPSLVLAAVAFVAFAVVAGSQTYMTIRYGGYFMLAMLIAEYTFAAGLATRWPLHSDPTQMGLYIGENSLIVLSPVGFIAANYVLLGRLARWLKCGKHLLVRPQRITLIFVLSDVFTFLVQASGAGLSATGNASSANLGSKIFLAGLILQGISFVFFTIVYIFFLRRMYNQESDIWNQDARKGWLHDWRSLAAALFISCIFILVRSGYRIAELSQGYRGAIAKHEGLFYIFDVLCLFLAVAVYTPLWPGRFIPGNKELTRQEKEAGYRSDDTSLAMLAPEGSGSQAQFDRYRRVAA